MPIVDGCDVISDMIELSVIYDSYRSEV